MRPPEPRREAARYIAYLRSVQTLFTAQALDAAEDGSLTRAELEAAWASATAGAKSFLEHAAIRIGNDNTSYWRKLAKGRALPRALTGPHTRDAWVRDNLALIADIGAKQINELLQTRTDAKDKPPTKAFRGRAKFRIVSSDGTLTGRTSSTAEAAQKVAARLTSLYKNIPATHAEHGKTFRVELNPEAGPEIASGFAELNVPQLAPINPLEAARARNVALIGGQTEQQRKALTKLFAKAQAVGERHESLIERVQRITGSGAKRAKLIARDQTVKHNAAVQEETARTLGATHYIWRTSGDEAVRPYHKKLNGTRQAYADPPVTDAYGHRNNPGTDYNCRCQAEIEIDLFAGLGGPDLSGSLRAQGKLGPRAKRGK